MKYLVIAYDEKQDNPLFDQTEHEQLDLYDYLRNEFDNAGIVAGIVECDGLREVFEAGEWLDKLYTSTTERAGV